MSEETLKRPPCPKDNVSMLKMKKLVEATGVAKSTILHYVNEGLLPKPVKTSPNMAYYAHTCIERIRFIKQLQSKHRLGLAQIKIILEQRDKGREVAPLIELKEIVFGKNGSERLDTKAFCRATGLSPEDVQKFIAAGSLMPEKKGRFDTEDVAIGQALCQSMKLGLKAEDFTYYCRFAEKIVAKEMALRKRLVKDLSYDEAVVLTMQLTKNARSLRAYVIDRVFQKQAALIDFFENKPDKKA